MTDLARRETAVGDTARHRSSGPGRGPGDRVLLVGLLLVAAATAFRTWMTTRTWFYLDDFPIIARTSVTGLDLDSLMRPYFGHVMPAGRVAGWLITHGPPYDYTLVVVELGVLFALAGVGVLLLLRTLFGSRPAILLLLTYFLLSPWMISSSSWWSAGINHLPSLAATAWSLNSLVHYLRRQRTRYLVSSLLWIVFGLSFAELTLLAYIPAAVITLGYFAEGSMRERVRSVVPRYWRILVAHGGLVTLYLAVYLHQTWVSGASLPVPWRGYLVNMFTVVVPSSFVGGPVRWHQVWSAQFEANPVTSVQLLGLSTIAGCFALGALTRHRSLRAWWIPLLQVLAIVVLIGQNRAMFGAGLILDLRFSTPLALGVSLTLGLAFLPVPGAVESAEEHGRHWLLNRREPMVAAIAAFGVLAVWSAQTFPLIDLGDRSPRHYFEGLEAALAEHDQPVDLIDHGAPGDVVPQLPESTIQIVLSPYPVRFPTVVQDDFYAVNQHGDLVRPGIDAARSAEEPDDRDGSPGCSGYAADGAGSVTVPLNGPVIGYVWRLRIQYDAAETTAGTISFGGLDVPTTFARGQHVLETGASAPEMWDSVRIDGLAAGSDLCVTRLVVGTTTVPGDPDPQPATEDAAESDDGTAAP